MKNLFCGFLLLMILGGSAYAQDQVENEQTQKREMPPPPKEEKQKDPNAPSFKDRLFFGGTFWLNFYGSYRYLELSPLVGYAFTPKLMGGVGITYRYVEYSTSGGGRLTDNQYGYRLFSRYYIIPQLFAHAEFESLNLTSLYSYDSNTNSWNGQERIWVNSMLLGGGVQSGGKGPGMFIMALYNVIGCDEGYCPYPDGWLIRVGVTAGF